MHTVRKDAKAIAGSFDDQGRQRTRVGKGFRYEVQGPMLHGEAAATAMIGSTVSGRRKIEDVTVIVDIVIEYLGGTSEAGVENVCLGGRAGEAESTHERPPMVAGG